MAKVTGAKVINKVREGPLPAQCSTAQCSSEPLSQSLENIPSSIIAIMTSGHLHRQHT